MKTTIKLFNLLFVLTLFSASFSGCTDPCKDAVCLNGGICDDGDCECPLGYTGEHCETEVDPCTQVTCPQGEICEDGTCHTLPVASFSITGNGCTAACSVLFTNSSEHATSYSWDFGDGGSSTAQSPSHQYTSAGTFTVVLTAVNAYGTSSISESVLIQGQADPCAGVTCLNGGTCVNGSCNCTTGYTGSNCGTEVTPSSMRITKIVVTDFENSGWDTFPASSPDIFINVRTGTSCSSSGGLYTSNYYQDAYPGPNYDFIPSSPIVITNPTAPIAICLYDDDVSGSDFMTGVNFTPYQNGNNFPSTRNLSVSGLSCTVYFTYYW